MSFPLGTPSHKNGPSPYELEVSFSFGVNVSLPAHLSAAIDILLPLRTAPLRRVPIVAKLEDLTPGASVRGILPDALVTVVRKKTAGHWSSPVRGLNRINPVAK